MTDRHIMYYSLCIVKIWCFYYWMGVVLSSYIFVTTLLAVMTYAIYNFNWWAGGHKLYFFISNKKFFCIDCIVNKCTLSKPYLWLLFLIFNYLICVNLSCNFNIITNDLRNNHLHTYTYTLNNDLAIHCLCIV